MPTSLIEFSQEVFKLNKEKKHNDVLVRFKAGYSQFTKQEIADNEYLISAVLSSLRKTRNIAAAVKFIELYKIPFSDKSSEMLLNAYGWILYYQSLLSD